MLSSSSAGPTVAPLLEAKAPQAEFADAEAIARSHFGITARAKLLTSERDRNFHLLGGDDGRDYLLKITNAAEDPAVTDMQTRALLHIADRAPGLAVPRVVRALNGAPEVRLSLEGLDHTVRVLTYLPGVPAHATPSGAAQRRALGWFLAELGDTLKDFSHPAEGHEIAWDLKHAAKLDELTVHIEDESVRRFAKLAFADFRDHVQPLERGLRSQVVHNDFQPHNVLVDAAAPDRVAGVIDFGDIVRTPLVYDVAIAASYQSAASDGEAFAGAAEFVAAYHHRRPLLRDEVEALFTLIAVRHAMTVTITEWRAHAHPENRAYILRNHPRAARGLVEYASTTRDHGRAIFRRACDME